MGGVVVLVVKYRPITSDKDSEGGSGFATYVLKPDGVQIWHHLYTKNEAAKAREDFDSRE